MMAISIVEGPGTAGFTLSSRALVATLVKARFW
jgi:hypothetical protein